MAMTSLNGRYDYTICEMDDLGPPEGLNPEEYDAFHKGLIDDWWNKFDREFSAEDWEEFRPYITGGPFWLRVCQLFISGRSNPGHIARYMSKANVKFRRRGKLYVHQTRLDAEACDFVLTWIDYCDRGGDFPQWDRYPRWLETVREFLEFVMSTYFGTHHADDVRNRHSADKVHMALTILFGLFPNLHVLVDIGAVMKHIKPVVDELKRNGLRNFLSDNQFFRKLVDNIEEKDEEPAYYDRIRSAKKMKPVEGDSNTSFIDPNAHSAIEIRQMIRVVVWLISHHVGTYELHDDVWMLCTDHGALGPFLITRFPVSDKDLGNDRLNNVAETLLIAGGGDSVSNSMMGGHVEDGPLPELSIDGVVSKSEFEDIIRRKIIDVRIFNPWLCLSLHTDKLVLDASSSSFPHLRLLFARSEIVIPAFPPVSFPVSQEPKKNLSNIPSSVVAILIRHRLDSRAFSRHSGATDNYSYTQPDFLEKDGKAMVVIEAPSHRPFRVISQRRGGTPAIYSDAIGGLEFLQATQATASLHLREAATNDASIEPNARNLSTFLDAKIKALYECVPRLESLQMAAGSTFILKPARLLSLSAHMRKTGDNARDAVIHLINTKEFPITIIPDYPSQPVELTTSLEGNGAIYTLSASSLTNTSFAITPLTVSLKVNAPAGKKMARFASDGKLRIHAADKPEQDLVSGSFFANRQAEVVAGLAKNNTTANSPHGLLIKLDPDFYKCRPSQLMIDNTGSLRLESPLLPQAHTAESSGSSSKSSSHVSTGAPPVEVGVVGRKKRTPANPDSMARAFTKEAATAQPSSSHVSTGAPPVEVGVVGRKKRTSANPDSMARAFTKEAATAQSQPRATKRKEIDPSSSNQAAPSTPAPQPRHKKPRIHGRPF